MEQENNHLNEVISSEELTRVQKAQQEVTRAKEILFVKELELRLAITEVYLDHKMGREDSIDTNTGVITRK